MEQLAHGQVQEAIETLKQQGRVHEITDRQERLEAIAKAYAERPEQTLVVSPDNRSRQEINERIHHELQSSGRVAEQKCQLGVLVPRQDMTGADRQWAAQQASSADLRFKVRGFSALNARMHIEGQRNAIDAQSAGPFLVLAADRRELRPARPLPAFGVIHQSPAYWV